jgi:hypothetical protein
MYAKRRRVDGTCKLNINSIESTRHVHCRRVIPRVVTPGSDAPVLHEESEPLSVALRQDPAKLPFFQSTQPRKFPLTQKVEAEREACLVCGCTSRNLSRHKAMAGCASTSQTFRHERSFEYHLNFCPRARSQPHRTKICDTPRARKNEAQPPIVTMLYCPRTSICRMHPI